MKPWLTKGILKSIKCKNQWYVKCLKEQNSKQWEYYKKFRNKLTHVKEAAKKSYFQDKIAKNKHNTSKLWQTINNILHRKSRKSNQVPKQIHVKDEIIQNPKNVSNAFNEYFVNVGNCLSNKISAATDCAFSATSLITINAKNSFFMRPIAESEILRHINGLKSSKSTGKFGIPIKYIKLSAKIVSPLLAKIYNNCIKTGCFPDILKIAEVIPLYKSGPKDICSNYRPISILSPFSKIFEKCLHFQLYNYFHQKISSAEINMVSEKILLRTML